LRESYENELTEIRSEGHHHMLLQNDEDGDDDNDNEGEEEDLESPYQNHLDQRIQKATKLLNESDEPPPPQDVISDENFW